MIEISTALSGKFDNPDYVPAAANFNKTDAADSTGASDSASSIDPRRYSQFDRTASQVSDATMSFGDFLDMINPLQHIPVISSVYREITGDKINPVSRVAGDILYGAAFGLIGAISGAVGGVADSVMEAKNGKDVTGNVMASLFGDDNETPEAKTTMLADNGATAKSGGLPGTAPAALPDATPSGSANTKLTAAQMAAPAVQQKLPFGGAMRPLPNYHDENLRMSVANATGGIRVGNTIFAKPLKNGSRALPTTPPSAKAPDAGGTATTATATPTNDPNAKGPVVTALPADAASPTTAATTNNTIPPNLQDDALIMKALGLYQNTATQGGYQATIN